MMYTAYSQDEYAVLPDRYKKKVVGITDCGEVMQPPLCPVCGSEMMVQDGFLSCVECAEIRRLRIIK